MEYCQGLNIININLPFVAELERAFPVLFGERVCLVNFGALGQFAVGFHCKCGVSDKSRR